MLIVTSHYPWCFVARSCHEIYVVLYVSYLLVHINIYCQHTVAYVFYKVQVSSLKIARAHDGSDDRLIGKLHEQCLTGNPSHDSYFVMYQFDIIISVCFQY